MSRKAWGVGDVSVQEDAFRVYLRDRDTLFDAILKSSDFEEEAGDYRKSLMNLANRGMEIPSGWADRVCFSVIRKEEEEEGEWDELMADNPYALRQKQIDESTHKETVKRRKQQQYKEQEGKGSLFTRIASALPGKHKFAKNNYKNAVSHYDFASIWPSLTDKFDRLAVDPNTGDILPETEKVKTGYGGLHFWHPSIHPLRKRQRSTLQSQKGDDGKPLEVNLPAFCHMLAGEVMKDDWENGTSILEEQARLDESLERANATHHAFTGMKTSFSAKRKDEMKRLERAAKKEHDKSFDELEDTEKAKLMAHPDNKIERDHNLLGSLISGKQGHHHNYLLYERDYSRWLEGQDEETKSLDEKDKRIKHIEERKMSWDSPNTSDPEPMELEDYPEDTYAQKAKKEEAKRELDRYAYEKFGITRFSELNTNHKAEAKNIILGEKRHPHSLGWAGIAFGLQWLSPKERSQVLNHIMKSDENGRIGVNHNDHQTVELDDKTSIPMGLFVRNFITHVMQEYKATQRGHSKLSPNAPKYPEKPNDIGDRNEDENFATFNALESTYMDKFKNFMGHMLGLPLHTKGNLAGKPNWKAKKGGGNRVFPMVGIRKPGYFKQRVKYHRFKPTGKVDKETGEELVSDTPIYDAMREAYDSIGAGMAINSSIKQDFHFKDFLDLVGWKQDDNGDLQPMEEHPIFDNWNQHDTFNFSKEELEEIRDAREAYMGFSKGEKPLRDIYSHYIIANNGPETENENYSIDSDGMARGRGNYRNAWFEGGGFPMLDNHYLEAIFNTFTADSMNSKPKINEKTGELEDIGNYYPATGLFGEILDQNGNLKPHSDMLRFLAPLIKSAMDVGDRSSQNLIDALSIHETTPPNDEFSIKRGKKAPRNNKNWFTDSLFTHLGGVKSKLRNWFASGRTVNDIQYSNLGQIEGAGHATNPVERNSGFSESIGANIGLKTDDLSTDQKTRSHEHEWYKDTTLRGAMHRPGDRFSKDSSGVWRNDENGQVMLGSPYDIHGKNQSSIGSVAREHRTGYRDSDVDWRQMMDADDIFSQMPDNMILRTPQHPNALFKTLGELKWYIERTKMTDFKGTQDVIEDETGRRLTTEELEGELLSVMRRYEGKERFLQLKPGMTSDSLNIGADGSWEYVNTGTSEEPKFEKPFERMSKVHTGHKTAGRHYDEMKASIAKSVEDYARDVLMPLYLKADPDAFDPSNPTKFISNHAQMLADAEKILMHMPHSSHGIKVTAPDIREVAKETTGRGMGSPFAPVASIVGSLNHEGKEIGHIKGAHILSPDWTLEEILNDPSLGLNPDDEGDVEVAKSFLEHLQTLPEETWGEKRMGVRAMTLGQFLQTEALVTNDWGIDEETGEGEKDPTWANGINYSSGYDWNRPESYSELVDVHYDELVEAIKKDVEPRIEETHQRNLRRGVDKRPTWQENVRPGHISKFKNKWITRPKIDEETGEKTEGVPNPAGLMHESVDRLHNLFNDPNKQSDRDFFGLSLFGLPIKGTDPRRPSTHREELKDKLRQIVLHIPVPHDHEVSATFMHSGLYPDVELHPNHSREGVHVTPYFQAPSIGAYDGGEMYPSVRSSMNPIDTPGQIKFESKRSEESSFLPFPSHDSYANIHGEEVQQQLVSGDLSKLPWGPSVNQDIGDSGVPPSESDSGAVVKERPTTISGLLLKDDLPKEMPLIDPLHKIFTIDDLNQLRGFTGEWVVSVFYEGERIKVKRRRNSLTITNDKHEKFGTTDSMRKSLRKVCKRNYIIDCVMSEGTLHISDIMEYDGTDVTDLSTRERVKVLRGQFDSHENVMVPSPSTLKITDDEGLKGSVKSLLEENKDAKLLLRDAKSSYMKGEEKHPKWVLMTKSDDDFHIPFGMEMEDGYFILHFEEDLVKYEIVDDSPVNPVSAMASLSESDYPILLAKSLETYWKPVFKQMLKESKLQDEMSPEETEEESAGIIKPGDDDSIKKPKKYLEALLRLEKRIDDFEKGHFPMSGSKGMYFDVESPRGPTELVHPSALPDYDMIEPEGQEMEEEKDYPGRRKKAAETEHKEEELETFGNP